MRIVLHGIVASLGEENVSGVRTDCVYTTLSEETAKEKLGNYKFRGDGPCKFEDIGSLKFEMGKTPVGVLKDKAPEFPFINRTQPQKQISMINEFNNAEAKDIIEADGNLLVTGRYPGTGKSKLALTWGAGCGCNPTEMVGKIC